MGFPQLANIDKRIFDTISYRDNDCDDKYGQCLSFMAALTASVIAHNSFSI